MSFRIALSIIEAERLVSTLLLVWRILNILFQLERIKPEGFDHFSNDRKCSGRSVVRLSTLLSFANIIRSSVHWFLKFVWCYWMQVRQLLGIALSPMGEHFHITWNFRLCKKLWRNTNTFPSYPSLEVWLTFVGATQSKKLCLCQNKSQYKFESLQILLVYGFLGLLHCHVFATCGIFLNNDSEIASGPGDVPLKEFSASENCYSVIVSLMTSFV